MYDEFHRQHKSKCIPDEIVRSNRCFLWKPNATRFYAMSKVVPTKLRSFPFRLIASFRNPTTFLPSFLATRSSQRIRILTRSSFNPFVAVHCYS